MCAHVGVHETKGLVHQGEALGFTPHDKGRYRRVWTQTWWNHLHVSLPRGDVNVNIFHYLLIFPFSTHTGSRLSKCSLLR